MECFFILFLSLNGIVCFGFYLSGIISRYYPAYFLKTRFLRYNRSFNPFIHLFVPCKGLSGERHIPFFLKLKHPNLKVSFIVEDRSDPIFTVIHDLIHGMSGFDLVIAGQSSRCGQKNYNLIKGIEASGETADVYVFLDCDIHLSLNQLRKLVLPLSQPSVTMTSGFQWNILRSGSLSERLLAYMVGLQHMAMNNPFLNNVWGGASAIRRADFEALNVKEYWSVTAVDDMSLKKLLNRFKKKAVFVPFCINESHRPAGGVIETVHWFERQVLYLKFYVPASWLTIVYLTIYSTFNYIILLISALSLLSGHNGYLERMFGVSLGYTLLLMGFSAMFKRNSKDRHSFWSWVLLSPVFNILSTWSTVRSILNNKIVWKNITYKMGDNGTVKEIIRD